MKDTQPNKACPDRPDEPTAPIEGAMLHDRYWLQTQQRRWNRLSSAHKKEFKRRLEKSLALVEERRQHPLSLDWDPALPVVQKKEEIARLINQNQVVVIAGETGSGKTTQLPRICLELGLGTQGTIGHTQPRRLAARSVAARLADELGTEPGALVGYKVRFTDRVQPLTRVKLMTDGILLAEMQQDPLLMAYDVIIIDEAHERSLNIDILLGYLKLLLPRRPDLKVIVTSATIDPDRFAAHFDGAPVLKVSGRTFPVEVLYRPIANACDRASPADNSPQLEAILQALCEIEARERAGKGQRLGDVLVFLSGEREIRETARFLNDRIPRHRLSDADIIPLFARLSSADQHRIFQPHTGRRIILATNVAETSLTVPGIFSVIDSGRARISRYSVRSKVQRLPVEAVSQASADQRKGRCGRIGPGLCIRLYDEADFLSRPAFTPPEIVRTNLAAVILQMLQLGLKDISRFPFMDPPQTKALNDGYRLLRELDALDDSNKLTFRGRQLTKLPIDPRLGRMLLAAHETRALDETLIVASALAMQDPRERPAEKRQAADLAHQAFSHKDSDFLTLINLWRWYIEQRQTLGSAQLRRLCQKNFLNFSRMREWQELHSQLSQACKTLRLKLNTEPADFAALHKALLTGLLGCIGTKTPESDYMGVRGCRFHLFPGSPLARRAPGWIMAAELVETSRLYARTLAKADPAWVEAVAGQLIKKSWSEPRWEKKRAQAVAWEQGTLYGLVIYSRRRVHYGAIDPPAARELLVREGLVAGHYQTDAAFFQHNKDLTDEVRALEDRSRRQDILVDQETLFAFYDALIPAHVVKGSDFEHWRRQAEETDPGCLFFDKQHLMQHAASEITTGQYPDSLVHEGIHLPLSYKFEPGEDDDGVSLAVPALLLSRLPRFRLEWLVPGMLEGKLLALLRSLPKQLRRHFVPAPEYSKALLERMGMPDDISLTERMGECLFRMTGVRVPADAWRPEVLDAHWHMNIQVLDQQGKVLGAGRDPAWLRSRFADQGQQELRSMASDDLEKTGLTDWSIGTLAPEVSRNSHGVVWRAWPALVDEHSSVALRLFDRPGRAAREMRAGLARLICLSLTDALSAMRRQMKNLDKVALLAVGHTDKKTLHDQVSLCAIHRVFLAEAPPWPGNRTQFQTLIASRKAGLASCAEQLDQLLLDIFSARRTLEKRLKGRIALDQALSMADIRHQLDRLLSRRFLADTPWQWLEQLPRYLTAIARRLDKLGRQAQKDRVLTGELQQLQDAWDGRRQSLERQGVEDDILWQYRWMLEEYRVSLFAQELGTQAPVSTKRLSQLWKQIAVA